MLNHVTDWCGVGVRGAQPNDGLGWDGGAGGRSQVTAWCRDGRFVVWRAVSASLSGVGTDAVRAPPSGSSPSSCSSTHPAETPHSRTAAPACDQHNVRQGGGQERETGPKRARLGF